MKTNRLIILSVTLILLAGCKPATESEAPAVAESAAAPTVIELPVRYSVINLADIDSPAAMTSLCESENQTLLDHMASLESFNGKATLDGYYKSLDSLQTSLGNMISAAQSLSAVHPDPELRTAGENCAQLLSKIGTDLSLSRPIFDAVSRLDTSNENPATKHSVEKAILAFRLSGVDKDEATREKIRKLRTELVDIGQTFDRNIREDVRTLELDSVEDLAGLPEDYIAAHPPGEDGKIRITTQYPDLFCIDTNFFGCLPEGCVD